MNDEMFKELGFSPFEAINQNGKYLGLGYISEDYFIIFNDDKNIVDLVINEELSIELHKAIHQQLIELGWV